MNRTEIAGILAAAGLRPQHHFGQHFMIDQNMLRLIAQVGDLAPDDLVLEVGPGVGNLTRLLAAQAGAVLAVDIDRRLLAAAQAHAAKSPNVIWMHADALAGKHEINGDMLSKLRELRATHHSRACKLVSNLPYNIAAPLIAELLILAAQGTLSGGSEAIWWDRMAFTVQWEMAQRMRAAVGTDDYGALGVVVQLLADVEILREIAPGCFWPPPKVKSALVVVTPSRAKALEIPDARALQRLVTGLFAYRRKTLGAALKFFAKASPLTVDMSAMLSENVDPSARPEQLAPEVFARLSRHVAGARA